MNCHLRLVLGATAFNFFLAAVGAPSDDIRCEMGSDSTGARVRGTTGSGSGSWVYLIPEKKYRLANDDPFWRKPRPLQVDSISRKRLSEEGLVAECLPLVTILANRKFAMLVLDDDGLPINQQRVEVPWPGDRGEFVSTFWRMDVCTGEGHDVLLMGKGRAPRNIYGLGPEGELIALVLDNKVQEGAKATGLARRLVERLKEEGIKRIHETRCFYAEKEQLKIEISMTNVDNQKKTVTVDVQ